MAASSNLIADIGTVITNGPSATTKANCITAAGPIMDYVGNTHLLKLKFQECDVLVNQIHAVIDSGDGILTTVHAIMAVMDGASNPSTTVLTDLAAAIATGPAAESTAKAIAAAGPIMDLKGNLDLLYLKFKEAKVLAKALHGVTDGSDDTTNHGKLDDIILALA